VPLGKTGSSIRCNNKCFIELNSFAGRCFRKTAGETRHEPSWGLRTFVGRADLTLPRMNGVEFAEELRTSDGFEKTVIVAISGYGADRLPQPSPFDGRLTKPVDLDRLLGLME
jgi:hypothetical protein